MYFLYIWALFYPGKPALISSDDLAGRPGSRKIRCVFFFYNIINTI